MLIIVKISKKTDARPLGRARKYGIKYRFNPILASKGIKD